MTGCETTNAVAADVAAQVVHFSVGNDESARRIEAVLGSLGYELVRDLARIEGDVFDEAAERTARRYRLTEREQQLLVLVLRGHDRDQIAEALRLSRATIKWHLHNVYCKLGVDSTDKVLRLALRLDDSWWLRKPLRQLEAYELLERRCAEMVAALRSHNQHRIDRATKWLELGLEKARRLHAVLHTTQQQPNEDTA